MKKVLFATSNESKAKPFVKELLKHDIEVLTLKDIDIDLDVEENGSSAIENALIKARAYSKVTDLPIIGMDNSLYLEGVPKEYQPGLFVRRINGKRLSDEELLNHYITLVKKFGKDDKLNAKWIYGMAIINNGIEKTYSWEKGGFYFTSKRSSIMHPGYPLDSISIHEELNKYFTDISFDDKVSLDNNEDVIKFIVANL